MDPESLNATVSRFVLLMAYLYDVVQAAVMAMVSQCELVHLAAVSDMVRHTIYLPLVEYVCFGLVLVEAELPSSHDQEEVKELIELDKLLVLSVPPDIE